MAEFFTVGIIQTALEIGLIYALVAIALFISYSILNIADLSTDGSFTLGTAVSAVFTIDTLFSGFLWQCFRVLYPGSALLFCRPLWE